MIYKMLITFNYDPETNEYTKIDQKIIDDDSSLKNEVDKPKKKSKTTKLTINNDSKEALLILDDSKFLLNSAAITLLGASEGDRIHIRYQKVDGVYYPIIGTSDAMKIKGGNKLTKSNTVSCRGQANEKLAEYGTTFTLSNLKGSDTLFVLMGDEPITGEEDSKEDIEDIDDQVDFDILDEIDNNEDFEITEEDFEL